MMQRQFIQFKHCSGMHPRYLCDHICDRLSASQLQRFLVFLSIQALLSPCIGVAQQPDEAVTDVGTKSTVEMLSYNGLDFVRAIADARVTTAVLMSDVTLQEGDWAGIATPLLIKRNFTVQGDPAIAPDLRILNMNWIAKKLQLAPGVVLRLRNLVILNYRLGNHNQAPGLDLLVPCAEGTTAIVIGEDSMAVHRICYPPNTQLQSLAAVTRPTYIPGIQQYHSVVPQTNCTNSTTASMVRRCWAHRGSYDDFGMFGADFSDTNTNLRLSGYQLYMLRTSYVCAAMMTDACVAAMTALGCATLTYSHLDPPWKLQTLEGAANPGIRAPVPQSVPLPASSASPGLQQQQPSGGLQPPETGDAKGDRLSATQAGGLAGGLVGGLVLMSLAVFAVLLLLRRRQREPFPRCQDSSGSPTEPGQLQALWACNQLAGHNPTKGATGGMQPSAHSSASMREAASKPGLKSPSVAQGSPPPPEPPDSTLKASSSAVTRIVGLELEAAPGKGFRNSAIVATLTAVIPEDGAGSAGNSNPTLGPGRGGAGPGGCSSNVQQSSGSGRGGDDGREGPSGVNGLVHRGECISEMTASTASAAAPSVLGQVIQCPVSLPRVLTFHTPHRPDVCLNVVMRPSLDNIDTENTEGNESDTHIHTNPNNIHPTSGQPASPSPVIAPATALPLSSSSDTATLPKSFVEVPPEVTLIPNRMLGKGSYGRVVEGQFLGERVAVKLITAGGLMSLLLWGQHPPDSLQGQEQQQQQQHDLGSECLRRSFIHEVEVLARCTHPNVVRLLAACVAPPQLCLVMELMDTSLEQLIQGAPNKLLPMSVVISIATDVACGLEYLHPTIVHRDIKPANVLVKDPLGPSQIAKLSDFGLARLHCSELHTRNLEAGTPPYMAPECFDVTATNITFHVDMYALGILLWVMLTGEEPWEGLSLMRLAIRVTYGKERPPLSAIPTNRRTPKLLRLIQSCWEADPRRRPAAAEAVKELVLVREMLGQQNVQGFIHTGSAALGSTTLSGSISSPVGCTEDTRGLLPRHCPPRPQPPYLLPQYRCMEVFGCKAADNATRTAAAALATEAHEDQYDLLMQQQRQQSKLQSQRQSFGDSILGWSAGSPFTADQQRQEQYGASRQWKYEQHLHEHEHDVLQRLVLGRVPRSLLQQQRQLSFCGVHNRWQKNRMLELLEQQKQWQEGQEGEVLVAEMMEGGEWLYTDASRRRFVASLGSTLRMALSNLIPGDDVTTLLSNICPMAERGGSVQGLTIRG